MRMYVIDTQKVNMRMVDTQNENVCDRYTRVNEESVIDTLKK